MKVKQIDFFCFVVAIALIGGTSLYSLTPQYTFDRSSPAGDESPTEADDRMREIKAGVQERCDVDHYWELGSGNTVGPKSVAGSDVGKHRQVTFWAPQSTPGTIDANEGMLYLKDVDSVAELHFIDEDEQEIQLTSGGKSALGAILTAKTHDDTPVTVAAADLNGNTTFTNTGTTSVVVFTLPAGSAGDKVSFLVTDTDGIRVDVTGSTEHFRFSGSEAAGGKYIEGTTIGESVTLVYSNSGNEWVITDIVGIWDIES